MTGQSHFIRSLVLIFELRKVTLPNCIKYVHEWMQSRTTNICNWSQRFLVKMEESDLSESTNCVHLWYIVCVTAFIHVTELLWQHSFIVRSLCYHLKSWYVYGVLMWPHSFMVQSWFNLVHGWGDTIFLRISKKGKQNMFQYEAKPFLPNMTWVTLPKCIKSVWMNAVTPTPYHEYMQLVPKILG